PRHARVGTVLPLVDPHVGPAHSRAAYGDPDLALLERRLRTVRHTQDLRPSVDDGAHVSPPPESRRPSWGRSPPSEPRRPGPDGPRGSTTCRRAPGRRHGCLHEPPHARPRPPSRRRTHSSRARTQRRTGPATSDTPGPRSGQPLP